MAAVETLEIEGELATIKQTTIVRQMPLKDLMPHLVQKVPVTVPLLPRSAVFVHWDESNPQRQVLYILAEMPPGVRTITKKMRATDSGAEHRRYRLAYPWSYFWFVAVKEGTRAFALTDYRAFHAPKKFESLTDDLFVAFVPNVYRQNGSICFGSAGVNPNQSIADQIDWLVNNWYGTTFNSDLDGEIVFPFGGSSFKPWVDATVASANCWKDFPEWTNGRRIKFTVQSLLGDANQPRVTEIRAEWAIPEITTPFTFGRAEEWLRSFRAVDRGRLKIALDNMVADDPTFVETPPPVVEVMDDGGTVADPASI